jgi:hypothetical protein
VVANARGGLRGEHNPEGGSVEPAASPELHVANLDLDPGILPVEGLVMPARNDPYAHLIALRVAGRPLGVDPRAEREARGLERDRAEGAESSPEKHADRAVFEDKTDGVLLLFHHHHDPREGELFEAICGPLGGVPAEPEGGGPLEDRALREGRADVVGEEGPLVRP